MWHSHMAKTRFKTYRFSKLSHSHTPRYMQQNMMPDHLLKQCNVVTGELRKDDDTGFFFRPMRAAHIKQFI